MGILDVPGARDSTVRAFFPPGLYVPAWDDCLMQCSFEENLGPFADQISGNTLVTPPMWVPFPTRNGSGGAMKVSTGTATNVPGSNSSNYARISRSHETGFVFYGQWMAYGGTTEVGSPRAMWMGIDTQRWDGYSRSFTKLYFRRLQGETNKEEEEIGLNPTWWCVNDSAAYVKIPGSEAANDVTPVLNQGYGFGYNENKSGFFLVGLVINMDTEAEIGGVKVKAGSYHRALFGNRWWDISPGGSLGMSVGRGAQTPQTKAISSSFDGGLNLGMGIEMRRTGSDGPCAMYSDEVLALHYPAGTEFPKE